MIVYDEAHQALPTYNCATRKALCKVLDASKQVTPSNPNGWRSLLLLLTATPFNHDMWHLANLFQLILPGLTPEVLQHWYYEKLAGSNFKLRDSFIKLDRMLVHRRERIDFYNDDRMS